MTALENLFRQFEVPLWGIGHPGNIVEGAREYRCIAFCLPYASAAVEALPDDELMNRCKSDLGQRAKAVYRAIARELSGCAFKMYDDVDRELDLSERGISQKVLGHLAGLGWIGRSSLLVTPEFGPRVRLATIFTRDEIGPAAHPITGSCGECIACAEACPAGAISKNAYYVNKCRKIVTYARGEYKTFCGLCMQVCPVGITGNRMRATRTTRTAETRRRQAPR